LPATYLLLLHILEMEGETLFVPVGERAPLTQPPRECVGEFSSSCLRLKPRSLKILRSPGNQRMCLMMLHFIMRVFLIKPLRPLSSL
jgi:hypothetical protein